MTTFQRGTRVVIKPARNADIVDLALAGRTAEVDRVEVGTDGRTYVVVTLEGDPARGLAAMSQLGHRFFFQPDELVVLDTAGPRVLVASLGDMFAPSGRFGETVVEALRPHPHARVAHFGIRVGDFAETARKYDAAVVVRAAARGRTPGTLTAEPFPSEAEPDDEKWCIGANENGFVITLEPQGAAASTAVVQKAVELTKSCVDRLSE